MKKIIKTATTLAIVACVMLAFMGFMGDDAECSFFAFVQQKIAYICLIALCLYAGKTLDDRGWLISEDDTNDNW